MSKAIARTVSAIIWQNDSVLCRRSNDADDAWEFPYGFGDGAETSLDACRRVVQEKLGCKLSTTWLLDTIELADTGTRMDCFVAVLMPGSVPEAKGFAELRWLSRDELAEVTWRPEHKELATMVGSLWDQIFMFQHL